MPFSNWARSHSRTVPSEWLDRARLPSPEKATLPAKLVVSSLITMSMACLLSVRTSQRITRASLLPPLVNAPVVAANGAESDAHDRTVVPQLLDDFPTLDIPHPGRLDGVAAEEILAIGGEGQGGDRLSRALQDQRPGNGGRIADVEQTDWAIDADNGQGIVGRRPGQQADAGGAGQDSRFVEGFRVTEANVGVVAGADRQRLAVGADGEQGAAHAMFAKNGHQSLRLPGIDLDFRQGTVIKGIEEAALEADFEGPTEAERLEFLGVVIIGAGGLLVGGSRVGPGPGTTFSRAFGVAAEEDLDADAGPDEEQSRQRDQQPAARGSCRGRVCGRRQRRVPVHGGPL